MEEYQRQSTKTASDADRSRKTRGCPRRLSHASRLKTLNSHYVNCGIAVAGKKEKQKDLSDREKERKAREGKGTGDGRGRKKKEE